MYQQQCGHDSHRLKGFCNAPEPHVGGEDFGYLSSLCARLLLIDLEHGFHTVLSKINRFARCPLFFAILRYVLCCPLCWLLLRLLESLSRMFLLFLFVGILLSLVSLILPIGRVGHEKRKHCR